MKILKNPVFAANTIRWNARPEYQKRQVRYPPPTPGNFISLSYDSNIRLCRANGLQNPGFYICYLSKET